MIKSSMKSPISPHNLCDINCYIVLYHAFLFICNINNYITLFYTWIIFCTFFQKKALQVNDTGLSKNVHKLCIV
jgi:hypothetical protein